VDNPFLQKQLIRLALKSLIEMQEPRTILNVPINKGADRTANVLSVLVE